MWKQLQYEGRGSIALLCIGGLHSIIGAVLYGHKSHEEQPRCLKIENYAMWKTMKGIREASLKKMRVQGRYDSSFKLFKEILCENSQWRNLGGRKQGSRVQSCNLKVGGYLCTLVQE